MPVLDTNFLIALDEREPAAVQLLSSLRGETLHVPAVVAVEYLMRKHDPEAALRDLEASFTLVHSSPEWILVASRHRAQLHAKKGSIRLADFWIACWAILHATYVVTRDIEDFKAVGVEARGW